jgi:MFS family permease
MLALIRSIGAILLGIAAMLLGNGLFVTYLSLRMKLEGMASATIGAILAAYFLGYMMGSVLGTPVVRRVGHIRAFACFAAIMCISTLVLALLSDPWLWIGLRIANGFGIAGIYLVVESWLNDRATAATRGRILALYLMTSQGAQGLGQLLLMPFGPSDLRPFIMAAALFSLSLIPISLTTMAMPPPAPRAFPQPWKLYRVSPAGVIACFTIGIINGGFSGLGPIYGQEIGLSTDAIGQFMGTIILGGLMMQVPIGRLSDRFDRRTVLVAVLLLLALASFAMADWAPHLPLWALFVVALFYGGCAYSVYPLAIAHTNDYVSPADRVAASGSLILTYGMGAVIGPFGGSLAMGRWGPSAMFLSAAVISLLLGLFVLYRMRARAPLPTPLQSPFVAVPLTSSMATQLDPRTAHPSAAPKRKNPAAPQPA